MSETDLVSTEAAPAAPKKRGGLTGMVLAELRALAGELNIPDTAGMRKGELIAAIKERQGATATKSTRSTRTTKSSTRSRKSAAASTDQLSLADSAPATGDNGAAPAEAAAGAPEEPAGKAADKPAEKAEKSADKAGTTTDTVAATATDTAVDKSTEAAAEAPAPRPRRRRAASRPAGAPDPAPAAEPSTNGSGTAVVAPAADASAPAPAEAPAAQAPAAEAETPAETTTRRQRRRRTETVTEAPTEAPSVAAAAATDAPEKPVDDDIAEKVAEKLEEKAAEQRAEQAERRDVRARQAPQPGGGQVDTRVVRDEDDDEGEGRGRRGRRFRDRRRGRDRERNGGAGVDIEVRDGDVLLPVAGIVDILDNYAFVRTTGYLAGPTDVYVSMSMVRKYGLRRGDAITGTVREPREGEQNRQKFNPLVRVDTINGQDPEDARNRPEFHKLTPLYPNERLRLETEPHKLTNRVIDLVMPVGKGQRALIVSPPKAGKTTILQAIANAITTNNPECHLMVVLVDERPEEVTDMQRSVKGEVIASTFDRPPSDHTTVAELSIERAKRLVEMGHDVVVLLDNITRLGRAYNLAAPASGRILSGGVDSTALYPPKRFLGAARNIEDGGSLTIFATALVETGSTMDTVIFEEFKGTGNAELRLDRKIAEKRVFPAIDVSESGTRKDELLMSPDEHAVMVKLRRVLAALDDQQAIDLLLTQLKKTRTNIEFLMQVAKNAPGSELD
ncbi:transcription termination factor Rho [Pseudonocardia thermophila]|uniref:Transcription termination factor Rho n=1 Tax=Pseudonocardia thermophila TaxID=1848 RepID=A0A1M6QCE4_PSETH|nr:transcription termination factor Rho [Pseudonocardia thermophila]SHK17959.1 transcription termination factor Rho [Pseudonocardia thermophila]